MTYRGLYASWAYSSAALRCDKVYPVLSSTATYLVMSLKWTPMAPISIADFDATPRTQVSGKKDTGVYYHCYRICLSWYFCFTSAGVQDDSILM